MLVTFSFLQGLVGKLIIEKMMFYDLVIQHIRVIRIELCRLSKTKVANVVTHLVYAQNVVLLKFGHKI